MSRLLSNNSRPDRFTYADYKTWPENERWELIHGEAWNMSPAPTFAHQDLVTILAGELRTFLKGKPCRPVVSPVDVFLPGPGDDPGKPDSIDTIVQPDLIVICDRRKIIPRGIMGAPDLVMEIASPSSVLRDINIKKDLYAKHGCREYWIWDFRLAWVMRFVRQEGKEGKDEGHWDEGKTFESDDSVQSVILPGFRLSLPELRAEMGLED